MKRIFKKRIKTRTPERLADEDSEFSPTKTKLEQNKITETLCSIDYELSLLNNHRW